MSFPWEMNNRPVGVREVHPRTQGMPPQYAQGVGAHPQQFAQYQQAQQHQVRQQQEHQRRYLAGQHEQATHRQPHDPSALARQAPYAWPNQGHDDAAALQGDMARMRLADSGQAARALYGGRYNVGHPGDSGGGRPPAGRVPAYTTAPAGRPSTIPSVESATVVPLPFEGGLVGLVNLGNSCFLNCVVQCLAHTLPFVSHVVFNLEQDLQQHEQQKDDDKAPGGSNADTKLAVVRALMSLLGHIWSGAHAGPLEPRTLMTALRADRRCEFLFNCKQQDAHECLMILLDVVHTDTNGMILSERAPYAQRASVPGDGYVEIASPICVTQGQEDGWGMVSSADFEGEGEVQGLQASALGDCGSSNGSVTDLDSVVSKYMQGMSSSELRCTACDLKLTNKEKFFILSLPLPEKSQRHVYNGNAPGAYTENVVTLEECFHLYENLDEEMSWCCDRCKKTHAIKSMKILSYPKILIVHLQRFGYVKGRRFKRDESIAVPATLFRPVNPRASATSGGPNGAQPEGPQYQYDIFAWSEHLGHDDNSGHYTAIARHLDGSFRRFDDHTVTKLPDMPPVMKTKNAYILFYERREAPVRRPL